MPPLSNAPTKARRVSLGEHVHHTRSSLGYSIETAARLGVIGHMTWRRVERGEVVQTKSYFAVDRAFGWDYGSTVRVAEGTTTLDDLPEPSGTTNPETARTNTPNRTNTTTETIERRHHADSPGMSNEYRSVIRDVHQLNYRELQSVRRLVDLNTEMFDNMAKEVRTALNNDFVEMRPYLPRYGHETNGPVAHRYTMAYSTYSDTWNQVAQLSHDAEHSIYHGRFEDLQDLYARIVSHIDRLDQCEQRLINAEAEAEHELAEQNTDQDTELQ